MNRPPSAPHPSTYATPTNVPGYGGTPPGNPTFGQAPQGQGPHGPHAPHGPHGPHGPSQGSGLPAATRPRWIAPADLAPALGG